MPAASPSFRRVEGHESSRRQDDRCTRCRCSRRSLAEADPAIDAVLKGELHRQREQIELIASENIVSRAVLEAQGSVLTNKYAEGYPGRRYYGGCEDVDEAEQLAIDRAKQAVRLRVRQRPAALRRAGQPGGVHGAAAAGRHLHGHGARPGRPPHPRLARQPVGQVVQGRVLRREARQPPDRLRADGSGGAPARSPS